MNVAFDATEFVSRYLAQPPSPARRTNKNRSGRSVHKRRTAYNVGRVSSIAAIYDGNDRATSEPKMMCEVREPDMQRAAPSEYLPTGPYSYVGRVGCV
jgi:hypothetical protein